MIIWKCIGNQEDYTYKIYKLYKTSKTSVLQLLSQVAVFKSKLVSKELSEVGMSLFLGSLLEEAGDLQENRKHVSGYINNVTTPCPLWRHRTSLGIEVRSLTIGPSCQNLVFQSPDILLDYLNPQDYLGKPVSCLVSQSHLGGGWDRVYLFGQFTEASTMHTEWLTISVLLSGSYRQKSKTDYITWKSPFQMEVQIFLI